MISAKFPVAGVCVVSILFMTACEPADVPGTAVVDSAGVPMAISEASDLVFAELDSLPVLSLGALDATGPTQFQGIQGVHVDRDGRIWVTQGLSPELRIFEADGSHWKTRGGSGEGPGEFRYVQLLGASQGDSVLVMDPGLERVTVFDPNGEFVRTAQVPGMNRPGMLPYFNVFADGSILAQRSRARRASLDAGQVFTDSVDLVRVDMPSASIRPYGRASGPLWVWTGQTQAPIPFTTRASVAAEGEELHLVSGPDFRVQVFDEGGLRRVYGMARSPRSVTELQVDAYHDFVQEYVSDELKADHLAAIDHDRRPTRLPAYDRVLLSSDGHTWAQIYDPDLWAPRDWDIFDAEGRFLGQVHVENQFYPMAINERAVYGVWRDTVGLEQIRAYRLTRP